MDCCILCADRPAPASYVCEPCLTSILSEQRMNLMKTTKDLKRSKTQTRNTKPKK